MPGSIGQAGSTSSAPVEELLWEVHPLHGCVLPRREIQAGTVLSRALSGGTMAAGHGFMLTLWGSSEAQRGFAQRGALCGAQLQLRRTPLLRRPDSDHSDGNEQQHDHHQHSWKR